MPSFVGKRPPAIEYPHAGYGPWMGAAKVHSAKDYTGWQYNYSRPMEIMPVFEQPKQVLRSAAQPYAGQKWFWMRAREHTATPAYQGRWGFVGTMINQFLDQPRMQKPSGNQAYVYPHWNTKPYQVIKLGGK